MRFAPALKVSFYQRISIYRADDLNYFRTMLRLKSWFVIQLICTGLLVTSLRSQILMNTSGNITIESYFHQQGSHVITEGGSKSDFTGVVDFYRFNKIIFYSTLGTTTEISKVGMANWKLARIWYSIAPGIRYEAADWVFAGIINHDCIHRIDQGEPLGSTWWNAFQFTIGTKESYSLYLLDYYRQNQEQSPGEFDGSLTLSKFSRARGSIVNGRNHSYDYYFKLRLRYLVYSSEKWFSYINTDNQWWVNQDRSTEFKGQFSAHLILKGKVNSLGMFVRSIPKDTFKKDNEDGLSSLGIRILF